MFVDGLPVATDTLQAGAVSPSLAMAPVISGCGQLVCPHFGGRIAELILSRRAMNAAEIGAAFRDRPDFELIAFEEGSKPWPVQTVQCVGNPFPQEPATLPRRKAPFSAPTFTQVPA